MDVLELATSALLRVQPTRLRNPRLAVQYAERLVALDRRRTPQYFALLAQAWQQAAEPARAIKAAREGLALLPSPSPSLPVTRTRRILELEAQRPMQASSPASSSCVEVRRRLTETLIAFTA